MTGRREGGKDYSMVLISEGNSEIGAQLRSNLCCSISLRHRIRSRAFTNRISILRKDLFSFIRAQNVLIYHLLVPSISLFTSSTLQKKRKEWNRKRTNKSTLLLNLLESVIQNVQRRFLQNGSFFIFTIYLQEGTSCPRVSTWWNPTLQLIKRIIALPSG